MAPKRTAKIAAALAATNAAASEPHNGAEDSMPPPPPPKKARKSKKAESETPADPPPPTPSVEPEPVEKKTKKEKKKVKKEKTKDEKGSKKGAHATAPEPPVEVSTPTPPVSTPTPKQKASKPTIEAPTFPITWANHGKLMEFYSINEQEATTILLQVQGPDKSAEHFWGKYRKTPASPSAPADTPTSPPPTTTAATAKAAEPVDLTPDTPPPKKLTKRELELISDSQLPESMSDDEGPEFDGGSPADDCDGDGGDTDITSTSSTNSSSPNDGPSPGSVAIPKPTEGPLIDTLETQPAEEAVVEPVTCSDPGAEARAALSAAVNAVPTPVRSHQVWWKQNC
eukprot:s3240_g6.t1